ncbi:sigma-70 family RNA polymerase sigma factor [Cellvibrio sp. PSBB023]|uniref:sigma-70 family RNA polymerase sigma factor n=1 Tax=Cellvibrio sp. PSBB023 TaxID=1945512 RepID=UPI0009C21199|nr:sigma-70 family RNA polymerase sigma factor [Cellvibrio sp. PSBB023]AQT62045.1 RNA polymerase subunit sigma [Cellvibrio sp. PSBB023]
MPPEAVSDQQFDVWYSNHHDWLQGWLRRRLGDHSVAADLAQDTFLRIWVKSQSDTPPEVNEPRAYLTTIAKRLMINYCERQSLERAFMATLEQLPEPLVPSIEEQAIVLETLHELDVLLSELPPNIRSAFLMSQLEGVTYEEIAVRLQVSVRTVTRYMAQGFRQCLRLMLTSD